MNDQTCHYIFGKQSLEKNNALCAETLYRLFRTKNELDRPLINFAEEDIHRIAEQFHTIIKAMHGLPVETLNEYIRSSDIVFQCLENIIIELNLALDQLSSSGDKAVFYRHLLSSQKYCATIFTHGLSDAIDFASANTPFVPHTDLPFRPSSSYKAMQDFLDGTLPDICALFQSTDTICPAQYEQAVADMKKLEKLVERQRTAILNKPLRTFYEIECADLYSWLNVALTYASELTQKLISLFSAFQSYGCSQSKRTMQSREEIVYYLTLFTHHYDNIMQKTREVNTLQDQARFLHKHTEPPVGGIISIRG